MPAQPRDDAGAFAHQVLAVIGQQPHLAVRAVEARDRQVGLAQRCSSDGQRVDRVGLAVGPRGVPCVGHQLRRNPNDVLSGTEQITLQAA